MYENTKKNANSLLYERVLEALKERATDRGETVDFTTEQLRNKSKSCVSWCKKAALTIKSHSGITRFRDDKRLGKWFMQLYPLVKSRDSCQHEQGLEPGVDSIVDNEEEAVEEPAMEKRAFVPKRTRKAETKDVLAEAVSCMNKMVENDNTKEYLNFL